MASMTPPLLLSKWYAAAVHRTSRLSPSVGEKGQTPAVMAPHRLPVSSLPIKSLLLDEVLLHRRGEAALESVSWWIYRSAYPQGLWQRSTVPAAPLPVCLFCVSVSPTCASRRVSARYTDDISLVAKAEPLALFSAAFATACMAAVVEIQLPGMILDSHGLEQHYLRRCYSPAVPDLLYLPCSQDQHQDYGHENQTRGTAAAISSSPVLVPPPHLTALRLPYRSDIAALDTHLRSWGSAGYLSHLRCLDLSHCAQLTTVHWAESLCADAAVSSSSSSLKWLNLSGCSGIRDFAPLASFSSLTRLELSDLTELRSLQWIVALQSTLTMLDVCRCPSLVELDPIGQLTSLRHLQCDVLRHSYSTLSWLLHCRELQELTMSFSASFRSSSLRRRDDRGRFGSGDAVPLSALAQAPFPQLRLLLLRRVTLDEKFTNWLASGCPLLQELVLESCEVTQLTAATLLHQQRRTSGGAAETLSLAPTASSVAAAAAAAPPPAQHVLERWWWMELQNLQQLSVLCVSELEGFQDHSSIDWITACPALQTVTFRKCRWLLDTYATHRLPRLRLLNLSATEIDDITFLGMRNGHCLPVEATTGRSRAASPPPSSPLIEQALPPTSTLSHLTELNLVDCPHIFDLSPLAHLHCCRRLFASDHTRVTAIPWVRHCIALEELYLINYTRLYDISATRELQQLRILYVTHSSISDLSWMLTHCSICSSSRSRCCCGSGNLQDKTGRPLPRLQSLTLAFSRKLRDVSPLGVLTDLRHVDLLQCSALTKLSNPSSVGASAGASAASAAAAAAAALPSRSAAVRPFVSQWKLLVQQWWRRGYYSTAAIVSLKSARAAGEAPPYNSGEDDGCGTDGLPVSLLSLNLHQCSQLVNAEALGALANLQYLDASLTGIQQVQHWMGGCQRLRMADLRGSPCCCTAGQQLELANTLPPLLRRLQMLNGVPVMEP